MTSTDRPVQRVTRGAFATLYRERRAIIVRISAGDLLQFREKGRRQWFDLPIETAFGIAARASAGFRVCLVPDRKKK